MFMVFLEFTSSFLPWVLLASISLFKIGENVKLLLSIK